MSTLTICSKVSTVRDTSSTSQDITSTTRARKTFASGSLPRVVDVGYFLRDSLLANYALQLLSTKAAACSKSVSPTVRHGTFARHQVAKGVSKTQRSRARTGGGRSTPKQLSRGWRHEFRDNAVSIRLNLLDHFAPGNAWGMRRLQHDHQHFLSRDAMEAGAHATVRPGCD